MSRSNLRAVPAPFALLKPTVAPTTIAAGTDAGDDPNGTDAMILLTRLNGDEIYLNPDLIERIEALSDTIVSLVDGKKYVATEAPRELISRIIAFRAAVLVAAEAEAADLDAHGAPTAWVPAPLAARPPARPLRLIEDTTSE